MDKDHLTIRSENGSDNCIVEPYDWAPPVFMVTADYVNITGFSMGNAELNCIELYSDHNTIANNHMQWAGGAIWLYYSSYNTITDNILEPYSYGIVLDVDYSGPISGGPSNYNTITDNYL